MQSREKEKLESQKKIAHYKKELQDLFKKKIKQKHLDLKSELKTLHTEEKIKFEELRKIVSNLQVSVTKISDMKSEFNLNYAQLKLHGLIMDDDDEVKVIEAQEKERIKFLSAMAKFRKSKR